MLLKEKWLHGYSCITDTNLLMYSNKKCLKICLCIVKHIETFWVGWFCVHLSLFSIYPKTNVGSFTKLVLQNRWERNIHMQRHNTQYYFLLHAFWLCCVLFLLFKTKLSCAFPNCPQTHYSPILHPPVHGGCCLDHIYKFLASWSKSWRSRHKWQSHKGLYSKAKRERR